MITIYVTETCAQCKLVEKFMTIKKQEYKKVHIDDDEQKRNELFKITGYMKVPVTTNGSDYIVGYNPGRLLSLI
jgi:glutaredoxin